MASLIYGLCTAMCAWISWSLWRHHARTRSRVLFWSALCFAGLTLNNLLLVLDKIVLPAQDFSALRKATALAALCVLIYGLVYEED